MLWLRSRDLWLPCTTSKEKNKVNSQLDPSHTCPSTGYLVHWIRLDRFTMHHTRRHRTYHRICTIHKANTLKATTCWPWASHCRCSSAFFCKLWCRCFHLRPQNLRNVLKLWVPLGSYALYPSESLTIVYVDFSGEHPFLLPDYCLVNLLGWELMC